MIKPVLGFVFTVSSMLMLFSSSSYAEECTAEDIKVVKAAAPSYPRRAKERGIEGYVALEFAIGTDGKAKDVKIMESEPKGTFDRAGMRAVMKTEFQPCMINGQATEVAKAQLKFNFKL